MFATARSRIFLAAAAAIVYPAVFASVLFFERPGLGIGHLFYLAIMLLAMATGPWWGAAGGVFGAALYTVAVFINPHLPPASLLTFATAIRLVTFVVVGVVVGLFASRNRAAVLQLTALAQRDHLTGLLNSRGLEEELARRVALGAPFGLLYGDIDSLKRINDSLGHGEGDRVIQRTAELLAACLRSRDAIARVSGDEFAALVDTATDSEAEELATRLERRLADEGLGITLGWAVFPQAAEEGISLVHAADKRLYERKGRKPDRRSRRLAAVD